MCVCVYVCICVSVCGVYVCIYIYIYICVYMCMVCVCLFVCMYVCVVCVRACLCMWCMSCCDQASLLQLFQMSRNPYTWHSSAKHVNMDVVGLSIYSDNGEPVHVKKLAQPIVIILPRRLGLFASALSK